MTRPRLDRFDVVALLALLILAFTAMTALVVRVLTQGGTITGGDGFLVADPMQYLNWLRQAGEHVGIGNLYDLRPGPRPFVHPGLLISGLLHQLGLGLVAAYTVWKPVAVVVLFLGTWALTRCVIVRTDDRRLALVLALFTASPIAALVGWTGLGGPGFELEQDFVSGELWSGTWLWGYQFSALAIGLMPLAMLAYERGRDGGRGRMLAATAGLGLLCAWLQPWQGVTIALVLGGTELWSIARRGHAWPRAVLDLLGPMAAIALPLVYYLLLSRLDASWELAGEINQIPRWGIETTLLGLAPLGIPALLALRLPAPSFTDVAIRLWIPMGLLVFYLPFGTFPFHAFQGLTIPLAVLAAVGVRSRLGERPLWDPAVRWWVVAAVSLLVVPGTLYRVDNLRSAINRGYQAFFLEDGERDALRYLDSASETGGVLTPVYLGAAVPAYTGRETYIGAGSWSPDFDERREQMEALFGGKLDSERAERLVRASGARFLLADCHGRADIDATVAGFTDPPRRFGCATVYRVTP
ncbi:MAG: hypothetical protein JHC95_03105 [Solirubrobacteraceae bacterium]|nr:hypothetical protein [Solirubrobacteraceae bacterium]